MIQHSTIVLRIRILVRIFRALTLLASVGPRSTLSICQNIHVNHAMDATDCRNGVDYVLPTCTFALGAECGIAKEHVGECYSTGGWAGEVQRDAWL